MGLPGYSNGLGLLLLKPLNIEKTNNSITATL
jgi:hypothetical protein